MNDPRSEENEQVVPPSIGGAEPSDPALPSTLAPADAVDDSAGWVLDATVDEFDPPGPPAISGTEPAPDPAQAAPAPSARFPTLSAVLDEIFGDEPAPAAPEPVRPRPAAGQAMASQRASSVGSWTFADRIREASEQGHQIDWEHVHIAMPHLLGQPAYVPPRRFFVPAERPFDPDDLPIEAERPEGDGLADEATEAELARARSTAGPGFRLAPDTLRSLGSIFRRRQ